ncbi:MAG: ribosome small subunit-dependent GTPase A [Candidatus Aquicultorales bacterium]
MNYLNLKRYGLDDRFEQEAASYKGMFLARVSAQHRHLYQVIGEKGALQASTSGRLVYSADDSSSFPAVGDWVIVDRLDGTEGDAVIHHILRRKSAFVRKAAGTSNTTQIIAANIDIVFICMSLNADFNLRRLERYLSVAWDSMATPVILLTKADLCEDLHERLADIESVSLGADILVCSCMEENGYQGVKAYIDEGKTIAFIGSSGVGKSTLINRLMGRDILVTKEIREDDGRGRHATTHRQLLLLPDGGIVIDTPGMRELQVYSGSLSKAFEDIEELASACKFKNCSHTTEPDCAVRRSIEDGRLSVKRFENYRKLGKEIAYEGLNSRQVDEEKINRMFGSKTEMKRAMRHLKSKNNRRS